MTLSINTNISAMIAQRSLNSATSRLNTSIERMSTGYKINHAADNAAGYSIANQWVTQLSSLEVATSNASMGADMLTTAEESYSLLTTHLQRIRDLTEQAANGTYGTQSLKAIQSEIYARLQEIDRISSNAEYNGIYLMSGDDTTRVKNDISLQVGLYSSASSQIVLSKDLFSSAAVSGLFVNQTTTLGDASLSALLTNAGATGGINSLKSTDAAHASALMCFAAACVGMRYEKGEVIKQTGTTTAAKDMLSYIDAAISDISDRCTNIGASQNRVSSAIDSIDVQTQNLTSSLSTLRDTDISSESSEYVQAQILQQTSATLLAAANQMPSIALSLI